LEDDFVGQDVEPRADGQDLTARFFPLTFKGDDGALPDFVVLLSEASKLVENCVVECVEECGGFLELLFLDFRECFTQDLGLFFDVF
jgi:hypothetical protein